MVLTVPGDPADVPNWSRSAADSIVHRLFPAYWKCDREIRPRGTADRQVYDDFFKGEREFQRDASNRARTYYEAALARGLDVHPRRLAAQHGLPLPASAVGGLPEEALRNPGCGAS